MTIQIGLSTCPNDTFAFHGLLTGQVDSRGLDLEFHLADVEELNLAFLRGDLPVSKVSFAAALEVAERVVVLPSGSAIGHGVGPVVLGRPGESVDVPRVLAPGRHTTAALLYRLLHPDVQLDHSVFSAIIPALLAGECDLGVCIHEGRFTWQEHGLILAEDLGASWEAASGAALPLGGLCASRDLPPATLARLSAAIKDSLLYGLAARDETVQTMSRHAQEMDADVLFAHVDLYVNDQTVELGEVGQEALDALSRLAAEAGLLASGSRLEVFRPHS